MLESLAECWKVQVGEICEFQLGFVASQVLSDNVLRAPVKRCHTTHHHHAADARLQMHCYVDRFSRIDRHPHPGKLRVELGIVRLLLAAAAKDNRDVTKECFVSLGNELNGRRTSRDDQIWLASLIFANVPIAQLVLRGHKTTHIPAHEPYTNEHVRLGIDGDVSNPGNRWR